jgi:hypothetical protein
MLENYYFRPATVDRIRTSWIAPAIEQYVNWLTERHYTSRSVPMVVFDRQPESRKVLIAFLRLSVLV